jgi:hypothetical protein
MTRTDVRSAFQYGLAIFTLTALLGLANATQLFGPLNRDALLTHLHSGTLGWITMGVIGLSIWVFGGREMNMFVRVSALATAAYVLAFWSGNFQARAIFGVAMLAVVYFWWWFVVSPGFKDGFAGYDDVKLMIAFGLTTLVLGSTIGVIVQVILGTGNSIPTSTDLVGAHASAQTGGYLVLVSAAFIEWQLRGGGRRTNLGLTQIGLLFAGGFILSFSLLLAQQLGPEASQALPGVATLLTLAGTILAIVRNGRAVMAVNWMSGAKRHIAIAMPWLLIAVVLQAILVQQFIAAQGDINKVSIGVLHSLDHSYFVGLMTNMLFGSILIFLGARMAQWPWADNVIFWGLNGGAAAFVAVLLIVGSGEGKAAFTHPVAFVAPIMGLSALLGIATFLMRLQGSPATAPAVAPAR